MLLAIEATTARERPWCMLGFQDDRAPPTSLPADSQFLGRTASDNRKAAEAAIAVDEASAAGCRAAAAGRLAHQRHRTEPEAAEAAIAVTVAAATMAATIAAFFASGGVFATTVEGPVGQAAPMAMASLAVADATCATA